MSATKRETITRCAETDLPADTCDHCRATGATATYTAARNTWTPSPPASPRPRPKMTTQPRPTPVRGLPILGGDREHGQDPDLHDMVEELTRPHGHRERIDRDPDQHGERWAGHHITEVPALVHQLLGVTSTTTGTGDSAGATPGSRPAARVESVDTLMLIDTETARWLRRLGEDDPGDHYVNGTRIPGSGPIRNLIRLRALHAGTISCGRGKAHFTEVHDVDDEGRRHVSRMPDCCHQHGIEHDVRRWWTQARIVAGWDRAAYRPYVTCPVDGCAARGSILISETGPGDHVGLCLECRSIWGPAEIGLLGQHVQDELNATRARPAAGPCYPIDRAPDTPLGRLCPACGTAACWRANTGTSGAQLAP